MESTTTAVRVLRAMARSRHILPSIICHWTMLDPGICSPELADHLGIPVAWVRAARADAGIVRRRYRARKPRAPVTPSPTPALRVAVDSAEAEALRHLRANDRISAARVLQARRGVSLYEAHRQTEALARQIGNGVAAH